MASNSIIHPAITKLANDPSGAAWITDWHTPGGAFHNSELEAAYQSQHPIISMLHPIAYGGGLAGAAIGHAAGKHGLLGFGTGLSAGMGLEGLHRYHHLMTQKKQASGNVPLEFIAVTPTVAAPFADHHLERHYIEQHPFINTVHPGSWGGGLAGAALGLVLRKRLGENAPLFGLMTGASVGQIAEGAHRAHYLMEARRKVLNQNPPVHPAVSLSQFHAG
jgi:hypothetical protein